MSVMVRMPTRGHPAFTASMAFRMQAQANPDWDFMEHENNQGQHVSRMHIVREAREEKPDFLIMIDDDVTCPQSLERLVAHDLEVVGVPIPSIKQGRLFLTAWQKYAENQVVSVGWVGSGLEKVWMVGTGVICIRKDVYEREDLDPLFDYDLRPNGILDWAEDGLFAKICRENGIQQWIDRDMTADHCKTTTLNQFARSTPQICAQIVDAVACT